jgi:hypothetical protein
MSNLLQAAIPVAIPAAVALLVAYQGALSRTGRLRRAIKKDVEVLAALPADHPSRATLGPHIGVLLDLLVSRERRRFDPAFGLGAFLGTSRIGVAVAALAAGMSIASILVATGVLKLPFFTEEMTLAWWASAVVNGLFVVYLAVLAFRAWRQFQDPETGA